MKQSSTLSFPRTIGMDLGTRSSSFCILDPGGTRTGEDSLPTQRIEMRAFFKEQPSSRVVIEASGPSRWIAELATSCGHEVIVANPREFRLIAESHHKTDRNDARILAEFGQIRPRLLRPIQLRGLRCQLARGLVDARSHLVAQRTELINVIRSHVRNLGEALPTCASYAFHRKMREALPSVLRSSMEPLFHVLEQIASSIDKYDAEIERTSREQFPETQVLRQVSGVGPITALAYATAIEDPQRFVKSRDVGAYVGLVSKSRSSGQSNPQLRISKRGDSGLRRLLVSSATYIIGPRGQDSDLKRFGDRLQTRGGQAARAKARIAVARKLAILLHRLWVTGEVYQPLRNAEPVSA